MIYVDTNVFVYAILNSEAHVSGRNAASLIKKIASGELQAMTSLLTWDELLWTLKKHLKYKLAVEECRKFLNFPNMTFAKVDEAVINMAQGMVEEHGMKPRDSIHAATAISHDTKQIISDDTDFDVIKEIKRIPIEKFK